MTSEPVAVVAAFVARTRGETRPERLATSATLPELCRNSRRVRSLRVFRVSIVWGCVELRLSCGPGQRFSDRPFCGGLSHGESGFEHVFRILQLRFLNAA